MKVISEAKFLRNEDLPNKYYKFLNRLRESGKTNMFGAGQYLQQAYGMSRAEASDTLCAWMDWVSRNPSNRDL